MFREEEWCTNYEGKCGNCHKSLDADHKYCRFCGTKRGEGKFEPYQNLIQCIYGPMPIRRKRKCTKCEKTWETFSMLDNEHFCPDCGSPTTVEDLPELFPVL